MLIVPKHDGEQAEKRQQAAGKREQEKLDCRIPALFAAPDSDQEKQRNQRELEEDVKENNVAGREDAETAEFEQEQHRIKERCPLVNRFPAHEDGSDEE